jgi:hypothetical protein
MVDNATYRRDSRRDDTYMNLKKCDRCHVIVEAKQSDRWKVVGYGAADGNYHAMCPISEVCESCFNDIKTFALATTLAVALEKAAGEVTPILSDDQGFHSVT